MKIAAALLAAGSSCRMGCNKMTMHICGESTTLELSVKALLGAGVSDIVIACSEATRAEAERLSALYGLRVAEGGATRGESVYNALSVMQCDIAVIHDGARCLVTPGIILDSIATAASCGSGIASLPARDAMRGPDGMLDRSGVMIVQTPQSFDYTRIWKAYCAAKERGFDAVDDSAVYEAMWGAPGFSNGSLQNQKLTYREDEGFFRAALNDVRAGLGEDTHRLVEGRKLVLGGVEIPFRLGLLGHSDADVLLHAMIDAMLGAAALGDIGRMFPDSDERYRGISSLLLLGRAYEAVREVGYALGNIDATVTAQEPKLAPYIEQMRMNIAQALCCDVERVSVKATTPEHTGPEGALECITARSVCTLRRV